MIRRAEYVRGGSLPLAASISVSGGGILVYLCGGDAPHIGSAVLAEPRESLTGRGWSCSSSVMNLCGHKDEALARPLAETLCRTFRRPVCVCAGVHVEGATAGQLAEIQEAFREVEREIVARVAAII